MRRHMIARFWMKALIGLVFAAMLSASSQDRPRYVFFFIGDGMGLTQRSASEAFLAATSSDKSAGFERLEMSRMPVHGMITTHADGSLITDSAAAGTALACGRKTRNRVVAMDGMGKKPLETLAERAAQRGMRVGIVSSVSIDHATPACFYSHKPSRSMYYEIAMDLANSDFHYFAGGRMRYPAGKKGDQPSALEAARRNGFTICTTREQLADLKPGVGKVFAYNHTTDGSGALYYEMDRPADHISLAEFTAKGIELLENPKGFFLMVEGGKIDWACHANDAAAAVEDVLAFDRAIGKAVEFYRRHPDETLIVVTSDHECGGMALGFAGTKYDAYIHLLDAQKDSYLAFDAKWAQLKERCGEKMVFEDTLPLIRECFGMSVVPQAEREALEARAKAGDEAALAQWRMTLTPHEVEALRQAFAMSMKGESARSKDDETYLLYGGYEPLSVKLTHLLNRKAGIAWTSYSHTGVPVPVMAMGYGQERFGGYYDNAELGRRLMELVGARAVAER